MYLYSVTGLNSETASLIDNFYLSQLTEMSDVLQPKDTLCCLDTTSPQNKEANWLFHFVFTFGTALSGTHNTD